MLSDEAPIAPIRVPPPRSLDIILDRTPVRKLEFVDIDPTPIRPQRRRPATADRTTPAAGAEGPASDVAELAAAGSVDPGEPRWSLWGDAEV
ncbi:MAG TPA: hypothetical protein VGQ31_02675 [Candidatus Limnocylindrales bacterium]|nr:hypothetical protein [Candidatus Limnocylindrales bacterium]